MATIVAQDVRSLPLDGMEFDVDLYKSEVVKAAEVLGMEISEDELDEMAELEAQRW